MAQVIAKLTQEEVALFQTFQNCRIAVEEIIRTAVHEAERRMTQERFAWQMLRAKYGASLSHDVLERLEINHDTNELHTLSLEEWTDRERKRDTEHLVRYFRVPGEEGTKNTKPK